MTLHFKPFNVTPEQLNVLKHLQEQDGITPKDLTRMADKDKTTISRIIKNLIERGGVIKEVNLGIAVLIEFFLQVLERSSSVRLSQSRIE